MSPAAIPPVVHPALAPATAAPGRMGRYALLGVGLVLAVTLAIVLLTTDRRTWLELARFPVRHLWLILGLVVVSWLGSGARIWLLAGALGYRVGFGYSVATALAAEFGLAATPGGAGGPAIRVASLRRVGMPLQAGASLLAADAFLDLVFFALLAPLALVVILRDPFWRGLFAHQAGLPALGLLLALGGVGIALALWKGGGWATWLVLMGQATPLGRRLRLRARWTWLRRAWRGTIREVGRQARRLAVHQRPRLAAALLAAACQWTCRFGVLPVLLAAFGGKPHVVPLILVQAVLLAVSLVLMVPGGGGSVELVTNLMLRAFVPDSLAALVMLLNRLFTYHLFLLAGGIALAVTWRLPAGATRPGRRHDGT